MLATAESSRQFTEPSGMTDPWLGGREVGDFRLSGLATRHHHQQDGHEAVQGFRFPLGAVRPKSRYCHESETARWGVEMV